MVDVRLLHVFSRLGSSRTLTRLCPRTLSILPRNGPKWATSPRQMETESSSWHRTGAVQSCSRVWLVLALYKKCDIRDNMLSSAFPIALSITYCSGDDMEHCLRYSCRWRVHEIW